LIEDTDLTRGLDVPAFLRQQVHEVHLEFDACLTAWVDGLVTGSTTRGSPVPALYLHGATVEDVAVHSLLLQEPPLFSTAWDGSRLARYAPVDIEPIRSYARKVHAATDDYLASLTLEAVCRTVDLSQFKLGHPTVAWVVSHFVVLEIAHLGGELMSAANVKGGADHPCSHLYRP
jgi:hypothetical protein